MIVHCSYKPHAILLCIVLALLSIGPAADGQMLGLSSSGPGCAEWTPATISPRDYGGSAFDAARGVTVLFGGTTADASLSGETWEWDGTSWTLRSQSGPSARSSCVLAYDSGRHVVVLFGGYHTDEPGGPATYLGDTWEWDGQTWTQKASDGPSARYDPGLAYDSVRGVTVLFGGWTGEYNAETWEWDGMTWTQRFVSGPAPRNAHGMAFDAQRGVTVMFGGANAWANPLSDTWEWDGQTWTQRDNGPGRHSLGMVYDTARQAVVIFGGWGGWDRGDTWEWNGQQWTLQATSGPAPRYARFMAYDGVRNRTVLFGGYTHNTDQVFGDTWEWDGSAWTLRLPNSPTPRNGPFLAYDSDRGVTVLFGGWTFGGYLGETWEWDGTLWTRRDVGGPSARGYGGMSYDATHHVTLLFGGWDGGSLHNDTWAWDGQNWTCVATTGPAVRAGPAMAFDSSTGKTLLFGGTGAGGYCHGDTWEWDGTAWTQRDVTGPAERVHAALAYDPVRQVSVLFGGLHDVPPAPTPLNDTWEWDGSAWTQRAVSAPPARRAHGMAYMASSGQVTLFGGSDGPPSQPYFGGYGETWDWNGAAWTRRFINGPAPRGYHGMTYDAARQEAVIFGGECSVGSSTYQFSDTWAYRNDSVSQVLHGPLATQHVYRGDVVTYHVAVQSTGTPHFQWRHNGADLSDDGRLSGALTDTLLINGLHFADAGQYDVVVTDDCGAFGSAAGQLIVGPPGDCDCDGRVRFSDIDYFVAQIPDNVAAWEALYMERHGGQLPPCGFGNGDVNDDGHVNFADIDPFVALFGQ